jgi:hypothetical protein
MALLTPVLGRVIRKGQIADLGTLKLVLKGKGS